MRTRDSNALSRVEYQTYILIPLEFEPFILTLVSLRLQLLRELDAYLFFVFGYVFPARRLDSLQN